MEHQPSSWPWHPHSPAPEHSNQLEGRIVRIEVKQEDHGETLDRHASRMTWHDRALQALALALWFVVQGSAHGKIPDLADLLLTVFRGAK